MKYAPLRILITDDDEGDRLLFQEILEEMNIRSRVEIARNGLELIERLSSGEPLPDLLFLDLNMPKKNGISCLKEIRGNKKFDAMSIAIYSTSSFSKDIDVTFREGANIYITKPSDYKVLKEVLEKAVFVTRLNRDSSFSKDNFVLKI